MGVTKLSMTAWLAGSTFSNWIPIPTRRSLQATRAPASMSDLDDGSRKRTLIVAETSSGFVVRMASPPRPIDRAARQYNVTVKKGGGNRWFNLPAANSI